MATTALGDFVGVVPIGGLWYCIAFDKRGNWRSSAKYERQKEAKAERSRWMKHHREIAKARFVRAAHNKMKRSG